MSTKPVPETLARHLVYGRTERSLQVERQAINLDARTAVLAFASELPYERHWGIEILDTTTASMRMGRLASGANLLCDHDTKDVVGVVESVEVGADRVARAVVRFGKSVRAEEVWQDVRDGIRRNVSVGYVIHQAQLVNTKDGMETYRVTDWEPFEVSMVSVPADATVGIGRALDAPQREPPGQAAPQATQANPVLTSSETLQETRTMTETTTAPAAPVIQVVEQRNHAAEITKVAASVPGGAELAMKSIQAGHTVEQFQLEAIRAMSSKPMPTADIGLSPKEVRSYSVLRALNAMANPGDTRAQEAASFERECSNAVGQKMGKSARGYFVPSEVQRRDLTTTPGNQGGFTVATELRPGDFIGMLRQAMVIDSLGVRMLTGLSCNISIPRQSGAATAFWVAENASPTESQQLLAQVTMTPKTVGAFTDVSRRLLLQSSIDVENMVQQDLAQVLGLAIQQSAINGTGTGNQPTGLLTAVTSTVLGGVNGLAPAWQNMIDLETAVANGNADVGSMAYLTNARVRGRLKSTQKFTGTNGAPVWDGGANPINGYQVGVTNAVPSNLVKGTSGAVCSAILFGNFSDLIIGMWGGLDLLVDPFTGSTAGTIRTVVLQDVDVAIRNIESFATMVDALTV